MSQGEKQKESELEKYLWGECVNIRVRPTQETVSGKLRQAINRDGFFIISAVFWKRYENEQYAVQLTMNLDGTKMRIYYLLYKPGYLSPVYHTQRQAKEVNFG